MKNKIYVYLAILIVLFTASCEKENDATPTAKFKILSVQLSNMPALDSNNQNWDLFDDADVFFNIEDQNHIPYYLGSAYKVGNVAQADLPVSWSLLNAYQINDISKVTYIAFYDYDVLDANDPMGYVGFTLKDYQDGKPTTITKTSGSLTVTITGVWY